MLHRHSHDPMRLTDEDNVPSVFVEPAIVCLPAFLFVLDKDPSEIMGPYRFVTRPVSVLDLFFMKPYNGGEHDQPTILIWPANPFEKWLSNSIVTFISKLTVGFEEIMEEVRHDMVSDICRLLPPPTKVMNKMVEPLSSKDDSTEANNSLTSTTEPGDFWLNQWRKRFNDSQNQIQSTETTVTTNINRNPDGTVHKETVTTERLADGTSKTTRVVITTPPGNNGQQSRQEETVSASPADDWTRPKSIPVEESWDQQKTAAQKVESPAPVQQEGKKKEGNWTWWFWSKK